MGLLILIFMWVELGLDNVKKKKEKKCLSIYNIFHYLLHHFIYNLKIICLFIVLIK